MLNKATLRKQLRTKRKSLSHDTIKSASKKITTHCITHPAFLHAKHIGLYAAHENEVDTALLIHHARALQKIVYLPTIKDKQLFFYRIEPNTTLIENQFGIQEPAPTTSPIDPQQLDLLFIPVVAFDAQGHRIGRGAGYYDRYLQFTKNSAHRPTLIGLAYAFQQVAAIEAAPWDVMMDYVVTEAI